MFIENAFQGLDLTVQGDGSDRLDFTYIDDLIQGVIKVIANERAKNQVFNLTHGASRSIREMVEILKQHFPALKVKYKPRDRLMPHRGTLSVDKARRLIGYQPRYPLEKGFVQYIQWYKELFERNHFQMQAG